MSNRASMACLIILSLTTALAGCGLNSEVPGQEVDVEELVLRTAALIEQGDYPGAERMLIAELEDPVLVANVLSNLGGLYANQLFNYQMGAILYTRALEIKEEVLGPDNPEVGILVNNLGVFKLLLGLASEAEPLFSRTLRTTEERFGRNHPEIATALGYLGLVYGDLGQFSKAERHLIEALNIRESWRGPTHISVGASLNNLATFYLMLERWDEALPRLRRAINIVQQTYGPNHPEVAKTLNNLGWAYLRTGDLPEAERSFLEAIDIFRSTSPAELPPSLNNLSVLYMFEFGFLDLAEESILEALELLESLHGEDHPDVSFTLINLATLRLVQVRLIEGLSIANRAISILDDTSQSPDRRSEAYLVRANLHRLLGDLESALSDLLVTLDEVESLRPNVGADDQLRADFFENHQMSFDLMVSLQLESGFPDLALDWLERGRARVLLDQLAETGIDLESSVPADILAPLKQRENDARIRRTSFQTQIRSLGSRFDLTGEQSDARIALLEDSLRLADTDYRQAYQDIKSASPLWQELLTSGGSPIGLDEMQREVVPEDGLLLIYEIGDNASHVFVIPPEGEELEVVSLDVTSGSLEEQLPAGPIRASNGPGALRALHAGLFPDGLWDRVLRSKEVVVIPDGALHRLPFEVLVVAGDEDDARYWLDDGPPVRYGASATALYNIERRSPGTGNGVLSVSDPVFDPDEFDEIEIETRADAVRAAFERAGGSFDRLPYTAEETDSIRAAFGPDEVTVLQERDATEQNLRNTLGDHRYLHLATHGRVDERMQAYLALAPNRRTTDPLPDDDGFLELREVYGLDLGSVMLAVLSACETNVGESYEGEGMFALSRGFLAAGAQRVVATQWQVSDRATAALIGRFFRLIADAEQAGEAVDYAGALRDAKRSLRNDADNPEWADPYYWAAFTITGQR